VWSGISILDSAPGYQWRWWRGWQAQGMLYIVVLVVIWIAVHKQQIIFQILFLSPLKGRLQQPHRILGRISFTYGRLTHEKVAFIVGILRVGMSLVPRSTVIVVVEQRRSTSTTLDSRVTRDGLEKFLLDVLQLFLVF
jgi:hypothetical protein